MRALTLTQPWASLVIIGAKSIETRSWKTNYRGRFAIHSAKGFPKDARAFCYEEPFATALIDVRGVLHESNPDELPIGVVLGTVELVSVRQVHGHTNQGPILGWPDGEVGSPIGDLGKYVNARHPWEQEEAFGDYTPGRYAWLLRDPEPFDQPVPARGALGLWEWDPEVVPSC